MANGLRGEIRLHDDKDETHIPDVPRPILEALYATVTGAKESLSRAYRRPAIIKIEDIEQLVDQLSQWSDQYDPVSRRIQITATTRVPDGDGTNKMVFHSLEELKKDLPGRTERISRLVIVFDFLARSEERETINQCELTTELVAASRRVFFAVSEDRPLGGPSSRDFVKRNFTANISCRYSDVLVARSLVQVFSDWYLALPQREFRAMGKFRRWLHSGAFFEPFGFRRWVFLWTPILAGALLSFGLAGAIEFYTGFGGRTADWILLSLVLVAIVSFALNFSLSKFEESEDAYLVPLFEITAGDQRRTEEFVSKESKREDKALFWSRTVLASLTISILASVLVNLV